MRYGTVVAPGTVPSTLVFIKRYHSLIPKGTQCIRESDLDSKMFCLSFHIPQCFYHLLKKSLFEVFPKRYTWYKSYLAFFVPVHMVVLKGISILPRATSFLKKISLRLYLDQVVKRHAKCTIYL